MVSSLPISRDIVSDLVYLHFLKRQLVLDRVTLRCVAVVIHQHHITHRGWFGLWRMCSEIKNRVTDVIHSDLPHYSCLRVVRHSWFGKQRGEDISSVRGGVVGFQSNSSPKSHGTFYPRG